MDGLLTIKNYNFKNSMDILNDILIHLENSGMQVNIIKCECGRYSVSYMKFMATGK